MSHQSMPQPLPRRVKNTGRSADSFFSTGCARGRRPRAPGPSRASQRYGRAPRRYAEASPVRTDAVSSAAGGRRAAGSTPSTRSPTRPTAVRGGPPGKCRPRATRQAESDGRRRERPMAGCRQLLAEEGTGRPSGLQSREAVAEGAARVLVRIHGRQDVRPGSLEPSDSPPAPLKRSTTVARRLTEVLLPHQSCLAIPG